MQIPKVNIYSNKRQSFKRAPGMTTGAGAGGGMRDDDFPKPQRKKGINLADIAYWFIIGNTLIINPVANKRFIDEQNEKLSHFKRDENSFKTFEQIRAETATENKTSNAFYHLNLFNEIEMPELKKVGNSLYAAKFNTGDNDINMTFSTDRLDENIVSGDITAQKDNMPAEIYTYTVNLDTLGSKTFDIELKAQNDTNSIKQTYERDQYGGLYYIDKENNKKIPVNEYTYTRYRDKKNIEENLSTHHKIYSEAQQLNYLICLIATVFQMLTYRNHERKGDEE